MKNVLLPIVLLSSVLTLAEDTPEEAELRARVKAQAPVEDDGFARPEIRNGTWYMNGRPVFWVGPWVGNRFTPNFGPGTNPLGIRHRAYNEFPSKSLWEYLGFNSMQVSAAPGRDGAIEHGFPFPRKGPYAGHPDAWKALDWEKEQDLYYGRFEGMPVVVDFAFGYNNYYSKEDCERLAQRYDAWHQFIPFCPEDPEGWAYYRDFFIGGAKSVLRHRGNAFLWELFNESSYCCMCARNLKAFAAKMSEKYGTIEAANAAWGDAFESFDQIGALASPREVRRHRGMWYDWCVFSGSRYAELLVAGRAAVRTVDHRKNVYFCEMAAGNPPQNPGMDYRKIAAVSDVLAIEGGWRYGYATDYKTTNGMEAVVAAAGSKHFFNCDFFRAIAKDVKPIVNNEHYCQRFESGERVPSHREDFITSLWLELFHGVSGNFTYSWDKRQWEYKTYEGARANVLKPGYKCSSMLNPWNVPPDNLDCFKMFVDELAPFAERLLPCPRTKPATVAVYFSHVTMIQEKNLPASYRSVVRPGGFHTIDTKTSDWYVKILHALYPVKVVFAEDLAMLGDEVKAVVFPDVAAESDEVAAAANRLAESGKTVIVSDGAFGLDPYLKPTKRVRSPRLSTARDAEEAIRLLDASGVPRYVTIEPLGDTSPITGLDAEVCDRGDLKLILFANLNDRKTRRVHVALHNLTGGADARFVVRNETAGKDIGSHPLAHWAEKGFQLHLPPQTRVLVSLRQVGDR